MIKAGEKFREKRLEKKLSLEDVSESTKIKTQFLEAIENGEYDKLPSASYAYGFVRNYARFLDMNEKETLALFRREFDEEKALKVLPQGLTQTREFPIYKFKLKRTLFFVFLVFAVLLFYILFQYRDALINPSLHISSPLENAVVSSTAVTVIGKTDPNATVYIGGSAVSVNTNGIFTKTINVFPGKTVISVKAVNSFGRQTVVNTDILVKPGS